MAAEQRRRTSAKTARLIALVLANGACLALVVHLWRARGSQAAEPPAANGVAAQADAARGGGDALVNGRDRQLTERIRERIRAARERARAETKGRVQPAEVTVAVHVLEPGIAGDLVAIEADRSLRPASNLKLVTTAAALTLLGPDWSFRTRFTSAAALEQGELRGDLVVRAGGDPLLDLEAAGEVEALLAPALDALQAAGLRRIGGALVLDEGSFEAPAPGPSWPSGDRWKEYCALAGGFSANAGCLTVTLHPTAGGPAQVDVRPRAHGYAQKLGVRTVGARQTLDVRVSGLDQQVRVEGALPSDVPEWSTRFAVSDPVDLFGRVLLGALKRRGIALGGPLVRERRPATGERLLATLASPLAGVLGPINKHSNNACADQLFLALGDAVVGRGTRAGGRAAVGQALADLGLDAASLVQVDGSGLSRENRVSARQITSLIDAVLRRGGAAARQYVDSLAAPAEDGTLERRFRDADLAARVRAKTGFINGTSALSGLIDARDGRTLAFSILVEYPATGGLNQSCWKPMQDAICGEIAGVDG